MVPVDDSTPNSVVNGKCSRCRSRNWSEDLEGDGIYFWGDLVEDRMMKGLLKLGQEFGRDEEGLPEWIFNKPSRSWIGSYSKGAAQKSELASMEQGW